MVKEMVKVMNGLLWCNSTQTKSISIGELKLKQSKSKQVWPVAVQVAQKVATKNKSSKIKKNLISRQGDWSRLTIQNRVG